MKDMVSKRNIWQFYKKLNQHCMLIVFDWLKTSNLCFLDIYFRLSIILQSVPMFAISLLKSATRP